MTPDQKLTLRDADRQRHRLSEWEQGFIDGLFAKGTSYDLSEKQAASLKKISEKLNVI